MRKSMHFVRSTMTRKNNSEGPIISRTPAETKKIAALLAKEMCASLGNTGACVLGLQGNLGSGKTTFAQGFAKGLGITGKIVSPTFLLMKTYEVPAQHCKLFTHVDCYRLQNPEELMRLGLKDMLKDPFHIILIEWADRMKALLPRDTIWVELSQRNHAQRRITLRY